MSEKYKKRILLLSFIFSPNIGGVESHLDDLCEELTKNGHFVSVITYQPLLANINAPKFDKKKNFEIRRIPWLKFNLFNRLEKYPILQMAYLVPIIFFYSLFYLIKNYRKIDIIQTHGFNMAIVGFFLSVITGKPFTVNTHVSFYFNKESLYAKTLVYILNKAKYILVLTHESHKELIRIGVKNVVVYHQWIDNKLFSPKNRESSRKRYNLKEDNFVVMFAGRFVEAKGIKLILEAAEKVRKGIVFVIVGSGQLKETIENQAKNNLALRFIGRVDRKELPILYSASDICLFPSIQATTTYAEGIPRVMIEALTCGTPLIATKTGGVGEVINDKVGFFIKPSSSEIVNIVEKLFVQRRKLNDMRSRCISYAKKEFGREKNFKIIEKSLL